MTLASFAHASDIEDAMRHLTANVDLKVHWTPRGTVTEFYNTGLKHYFRTADAAEVTAIQQGAAGPGWQLTGDDFMSWTASFKPPNSLPVCRFYAAGPNSHFYTIDAAECEAVKRDPGWKYEGVAFYALAPTNGQCGSEYRAVYRLYNDGFVRNDSNHKFTTSLTTYQTMQAATPKWTGEGTVMCAPLPTTADQQKTELLLGGSGVWTVGPYRFGNTTYTDILRFIDLYQSPSTGTIYAQGINKYGAGYPILGGYTASNGKWLILSSYTSSGGYPYDVYEVTIAPAFFMSGCYYFWSSSTASLGPCTSITGHL